MNLTLTHNPLIRSDEGLTLETSATVSLTASNDYPHQHSVDTPVCIPLGILEGPYCQVSLNGSLEYCPGTQRGNSVAKGHSPERVPHSGVGVEAGAGADITGL